MNLAVQLLPVVRQSYYLAQSAVGAVVASGAVEVIGKAISQSRNGYEADGNGAEGGGTSQYMLLGAAAATMAMAILLLCVCCCGSAAVAVAVLMYPRTAGASARRNGEPYNRTAQSADADTETGSRQERLARLAEWCELAGEEGLHDAAKRTRTSVPELRRWRIHWKLAMAGPTRR